MDAEDVQIIAAAIARDERVASAEVVDENTIGVEMAHGVRLFVRAEAVD